MRRRDLVALVLALGLLPLGTCVAAAADMRAETHQSAFELLKRLVGTWEGDGPEGPMRAIYSLTGMGSAVVETFYPDGPHNGSESTMSSVYHMDGDELMLTHYCGAGNQPRMKAVSFDRELQRLRFEMFDITNLSGPSAHYSSQLEVEFRGDTELLVRFGSMEFELARVAE